MPKPKCCIRLTPELFVLAWQRAGSVQEAADALTSVTGKTVSRSALTSRATHYRSKGVQLKRMAGG